MEGAVTISKKQPAFKSMQYEDLRLLGIRHIQELAGKLWTDYNTHDPGINMLEVIIYAITELGYRVNYDIMDILTQDPNDVNAKDIQNFYTACQILPNCPLTIKDYRKLMMDVDVADSDDLGNPVYAGIKNGWINCVRDAAEKTIYVNHDESKLDLAPIPGIMEQDTYHVRTLYDVLLEFDKHEIYGDLNENKQSRILRLDSLSPPNIFPLGLSEMGFEISVELPRWDEPHVNWESIYDIRSKIKDKDLLKIRPVKVPDGYLIEVKVNDVFSISIEGKKTDGTILSPTDFNVVPGVDDNITILIEDYQKKIVLINRVICALKDRLHANRNLCDDFFRFHALKIEEILLCTDIELANDADVEAVEAELLLAVSNFLAPPVYFYTLEEMRHKCRNARRYPIAQISKSKKTVTIAEALMEDINNDDVITIENTLSNGEYTVKCIDPNPDLSGHFDITVLEEIISEELLENAALYKGVFEADTCLTVDQIFEGPKLKHGFIDDRELEKAERKKSIHVSDLIRIIMDIEGVVAVKNIQIANVPQDNDDGILSKSVRWCLELAFDNFYVPRLNIPDSRIKFFKGQLPYVGKKEEVYERLKILEGNERPRRIHFPVMDIPVPIGTYHDLSEYTSIQEHFPLFYGVGSEGIPGLSALSVADQKRRQGLVKQHKGFLLFFDQFLANFLSQLDHVKELFSMNGNKNQFGEYEIGQSYFAQSLYDVIPNGTELFASSTAYDHSIVLNEIIERHDVFEPRRNKFLDHLLGRFGESFTDYALLTYKVSGAKGSLELIEDKLQFLKKYPILSASRGKGLNYKKPCQTWHVDNVSGLELRAPLLTGMAPVSFPDLIFSSNFVILPSGTGYVFEVKNNIGTSLVSSANIYTSEGEIKEAIETLIVQGAIQSNFKITENAPNWEVKLGCENLVPLIFTSAPFASFAAAESEMKDLNAVLKTELLDNPEANRKNLSCPILNYFEISNIVTTPATVADPALVGFDYKFYKDPISHNTGIVLLEGNIVRPSEAVIGSLEMEVFLEQTLWEIISRACETKNYLFQNYQGGFRFVLCDRLAEPIGHSVEMDFNNQLLVELADLNPIDSSVGIRVDLEAGELIDGIQQATFSNVVAYKEILSLDFDDPFDFINASDPITVAALSFRNAFPIDFSDAVERYFEVTDLNLINHLFAGDSIEAIQYDSVADVLLVEDVYSILTIETDGATYTRIYVKEEISNYAPTVKLSYQKVFEVSKVVGNKITILGKEEEKALAKFIAFLKSKFYTSEGMHLIEHTLLRPRVCANMLEVDDPLGLGELVSAVGDSFPILEWNPFDHYVLLGTGIPLATGFEKGEKVVIKNSVEEANNKIYYLQGVEPIVDATNVVVHYKITFVHDALMEIHLDQDCESCKFKDPYSCVATVVMPFWPGRFQNMDVRKFIEQTIRTETPAHVLLNICWVNCADMNAFERAYKEWLLAAAEKVPNEADRSSALAHFIKILSQIRTVYAKGTLHSCDDEDEGLGGSIILNNSALGLF